MICGLQWGLDAELVKPISGQNVAGAASIYFKLYWDLGRANIALNESTIRGKRAYRINVKILKSLIKNIITGVIL